MSQEVTVNASVQYEDANDVNADVEIENLIYSLATVKLHHSVQSVATSEEAVGLGDVSSKGLLILVNLDPTNYIEVKVATSGAIFAKLFPKGSAAGINFCLVHLGSGAQAPFVIANSASCEMEILLCAL